MSTLQATEILPWIVAQASSLSERVNDPSICPSTVDAESAAALARLETWQQVSAKGDLDRFLQRLALDQLDLTEIQAYLGEVTYDDQHPLPAWAKTLEAVMQAADRWSKQPGMLDWQFSQTTEAIAFEPFYAPCLEVAIERLTTVVTTEQFQRLSAAADQTLRFSLIERLQPIVARTLFQEFSDFRSTGNLMRDFFFLQFQGRKSQTKYHDFLHKIFQDGYRYLFTTYPVLGRLVATAIEFWVEAIAGFLQNLSEDWAQLEQQFSQSPLKQVVELTLGLSDPHNRGRTTIVLQFETGLRLVYKPKDLGTDIAYFQFLDWCNRQGLALPFQCLSVLNRTSHGWVEFVAATACEDAAAAHRFYRRSGMMLCLIHTLEGTDCHYENLIAQGDQPILIDTETLLTHRMVMETSDQPPSIQSALQRVEQQLHESVLRTMLLPQRDSMNNDLIQVDLSGFGGVEEQAQTTIRLRDINTDGMQVEFVTTTVQPNANAPVLDGKVLSPEVYLEDLVTGFEIMADFLRQHQAQLLGAESPLTVFANRTVRYVFRATNTYATILQQSYQPEFLKSGVDRSIHLEILSRAFLVQSQVPRYAAMLKVEQQAMEQMDIPFFTLNSSQDSLPVSEELSLPAIFQAPSFDQVLKRIRQLDQPEIDRQVEIIRGTFDARFFQEPTLTETTQPQSQLDPCSSHHSNHLASRLTQAAIQLAETIEQSAIQGDDDSLTWLSVVSRGKSEGFHFGNVGINLADGSGGIALFFAALYQVTGNDRWHNLSLRALHPLRQVLQLQNPQLLERFIRQQGLSGSTGLTGILYSLMQSGNLLKLAELRKEAYLLTTLIQPEAITLNLGHDVNQGLAGMILGLLVRPEDEHALRLATHCGNLLLSQKAQFETALKSSDSINFQPLIGFYQGFAGVAYALLRLYAVTQDGRFCQAAIDIIEYERQFITQEFPMKAPGIGLARLGSLALIDMPEIRQDIEQALRTTQKYGIWGIDSLQWGNFGRLETLFTASQRLQRPELETLTQQVALQRIHQASDRGHFTLFANTPSHPSVIPGLFYGLAGIGYQILRFAHPQLPSILLWETA